MILGDSREVIFESREAIEARVKATWAEAGFELSYESFSVAQRLVDVWTNLLYNNQETVRELYSQLSLNSEGEQLDRFVEKLGVRRLNLPWLSYAWKNQVSSITDRRFTFIELPGLPDTRRVRFRTGRGLGSNLGGWVTEEQLGVFAQKAWSPLEQPDGRRRMIIETDIADFEYEVTRNVWTKESIERTTLFPHIAAPSNGRTFTINAARAMIYRNSNLNFPALRESDESLRSRIITNGLSLLGIETELNKLCYKSQVQLINGQFKITMQGYEATEPNNIAFWRICDAYLPVNFQFQRVDVSNNEIIVEIPDLPTGRVGHIFVESYSVVYIHGLNTQQQQVLSGTLPAVISYPSIWIMLGHTYTQNLERDMIIRYTDTSGRIVELSRNASERPWGRGLSTSMTQENGTSFKAVFE